MRRPELIKRRTIMNRTALIIGATGGIGSETARALLAPGWRVRALHRNPSEVAERFAWLGPVEWIQGDAMNTKDVVTAADGASVVVHAANPPGYRNLEGPRPSDAREQHRGGSSSRRSDRIPRNGLQLRRRCFARGRRIDASTSRDAQGRNPGRD